MVHSPTRPTDNPITLAIRPLARPMPRLIQVGHCDASGRHGGVVLVVPQSAPDVHQGRVKKWDDAAPQPAMGGEDHDDDERHIIRKKAWRSRHVLTSEPIVSKLCAATFVAIPLDAADPGSSPILRAQRQVASGSLRGVSSGRFNFEADRGSP